MTGSTSSSPFGSHGGAVDFRAVADGARELYDRVRSSAAPEVGTRRNGSDVRGAVLVLLLDEPMDGYRIVRELQTRGGGAPTPGAGAVYPVLQLLADEGLTEVSEADGRKVHALTAAGRIAAEAAQERSASSGAPESSARRGSLARNAAQLVQTAVLVSQTGTAEQSAEAAAVLDAARRRLIAILARD